MKAVKIIYGSCGGNTELVCLKVADLIQDAGYKVSLLNAKIQVPDVFKGEEALILASPTYGVGELETFMASLLKAAGDMTFVGRLCAVIALGDERYHPDYYMESMRILAHWLKQRGATFATGPLMVGKHPLSYLETAVPAWTDRFLQAL